MTRQRRTYGLYLADLSHQRTQSHGIVNYALGLATCIPATLADGERLVLFVNDEIAGTLHDAQLGPPAAGVDVRLVPRPRRALDRLYNDHVRSLRWARDAGVDVLHFPKGFVPVRHGASPAVVATVHDDIPRRYRSGAWGPADRSLHVAYFSWALRHAVRRADEVITVSEFSRRQLERLGRPHERSPITVTGQGVAPSAEPPLPLGQRGPYLFHFASPLPHKRSAEVVRRTLRWLDLHPDAALRLRVLGQLPDGVGDLTTHPRLEWISAWMTDADVATELRHARALLFSSVYEGFGRPPVEAMMHGTPVVYARAGATADILDGVPGGYDPDDPGAFERALDAALSLEGPAIAAAAQRLHDRHRWSDVAQRTVAVYRRAASRA